MLIHSTALSDPDRSYGSESASIAAFRQNSSLYRSKTAFMRINLSRRGCFVRLMTTRRLRLPTRPMYEHTFRFQDPLQAKTTLVSEPPSGSKRSQPNESVEADRVRRPPPSLAPAPASPG